MNKTLKIVGIILLLALLGFFVWFFFLRNTAPTGVIPEGEENVAEEEGGETVVIPTGEVEPGSIARSFVERFGSFSTEADYQNVTDVIPLATTQLSARLQTIAEEARAEEEGDYYGVSTRVIIVEVEEETDDAVTLRLTTQREESIGSPEDTSLRYQDILVYLQKHEKSWLVDNFTWQE
ncbi:MAG: hypothetical protein WC730_01630 [Patescibacteria group bacterium]|jgi:hypothetical protein